MVRLLVAAVVCLVILRLGLVVLRALARPAPEPPPPGELRRVNLRYRYRVAVMNPAVMRPSPRKR
ncbi:MAG TPA: hypothetical protein VM263_12470 [Acidimicrobiales bacterium]|nr:hypothetical protein [Acidimicrobiales bacterium]